jgi:hypothetical protein
VVERERILGGEDGRSFGDGGFGFVRARYLVAIYRDVGCTETGLFIASEVVGKGADLRSIVAY